MAAKTKAKGLGKGLEALFGDAEVAPAEKKPAARKKQTADSCIIKLTTTGQAGAHLKPIHCLERLSDMNLLVKISSKRIRLKDFTVLHIQKVHSGIYRRIRSNYGKTNPSLKAV